jgi:hypothetical protein
MYLVIVLQRNRLQLLRASLSMHARCSGCAHQTPREVLVQTRQNWCCDDETQPGKMIREESRNIVSTVRHLATEPSVVLESEENPLSTQSIVERASAVIGMCRPCTAFLGPPSAHAEIFIPLPAAIPASSRMAGRARSFLVEHPTWSGGNRIEP